MKTLKFQSHLVPLILSGEKTVTWRLFDDKNLQAGDKLEFVDSTSRQPFARAEILSVLEKKFRDLSTADKVGHETYANDQQMLWHFADVYQRPVDLDTTVKIVKYKVFEAKLNV